MRQVTPTGNAHATVLEVFVETEDVAAALEESVGMSPGSVPWLAFSITTSAEVGNLGDGNSCSLLNACVG